MCVCRGRRAKNAEGKEGRGGGGGAEGRGQGQGHSYYFAGALKENTLVLFSPLPAGK